MNPKIDKFTNKITFVLIIILSLHIIGRTQGAPNMNTLVKVTVPSLAGVRILKTSLIPDPFLNTSIRNTLGYGRTSALKIPLFEINGEPVLGIRGALISAELGFEYQYQIQRWMAVWARFGIATRMGTGLQSLLSQGVSAISGYEIGWLFRLWHAERHQLSAAVAVRNSSVTIIDLYTFVANAIETGEINEDNRIIKTAPTITAGPDVRYAYAINHYLALTAFLRLSYGESISRKDGNELTYSMGGMLHFDLNRKFKSPIGLGAGYKFSTLPEDGDLSADRIQMFNIKLSYTGRSDFDVGLDLMLQKTPLHGLNEEVSYLSALISMCYFF